MSQELVLKSKNYLDKNTTFQKVSHFSHDTNIMIATAFIFGSLVPAVWTATSSNAWTLISIFVTIPLSLMVTAISNKKFARRRLKQRVLSSCKKMGLKLTAEEKKTLKNHCDSLGSFNMMLSDRLHHILVHREANVKHLIKVESSQDALLRQVVTNAITMKSESNVHDLDIKKMVLEDSVITFKKEISRQVMSLNVALEEDPDFKIDNGRVSLGSKKVIEEYKALKSLYENDLDRRMKESSSS